MGVSKIGVPQNGWFRMEHLIKMDDLGVPLFLETSIYTLWKCVCVLSILIPLLVLKTRLSSSALKEDWLGKLHVRVSGTGGDVKRHIERHLASLWGFHSSVKEAQNFFPSVSTKLFGRDEVPRGSHHIAKKREIWKDRCRKTIFISVKSHPLIFECQDSVGMALSFGFQPSCWPQRPFSTVAVDGSIFGAPKKSHWLGFLAGVHDGFNEVWNVGMHEKIFHCLHWGPRFWSFWNRVKCYNGAPLCTMVHWAENWWFDYWWLSGAVAVLEID